MNRKVLTLAAGLAALVGTAPPPAFAATAPHAARSAQHPDLSGFWIPRQDALAAVPPATLTPAFEALAKDPANLAPGRPLAYVERWCIHRGMPSDMISSGPMDIVQTPKETLITFDVGGAAQRYIYTDGRKRPSAEVLDNTSNGFSVGHWQGRTFLVDTAAFSAVGVRDIPGGGWRGEGSHLVERFDLTDGGKTLTVTQTWTDPKVFAKPHTYTLKYDQAPAGYSAKEVYCDGRVPSRAAPILVGEY